LIVGVKRLGEWVEIHMTLRACVAGIALAASTAFSVCSAAAADLPVRPAPAPMAPVAYAPAAIYNWTGLYIGGQLGAGGAGIDLRVANGAGHRLPLSVRSICRERAAKRGRYRVRKLYGMDVAEPTRTRADDRNPVIPV